jgi:hypothetical protein
MNRLTRDQILQAGLSGSDIASLDAHDRPHGSIVEAAYSIEWLQSALDQVHASFPWGAALARTTFAFASGTDTYDLPLDFILDYEDGIILTATAPATRLRMQKWSLDNFLDAQVSSLPGTAPTPGTPRFYVLHGIGQTTPGRGFCTKLQVWPIPNATYSAQLTYYSLPNILTDGAKVPTFPSDHLLVEYITLKGQVWGRVLPADVPDTFLQGQIGRLVQSPGMGREAGRTNVPLDRKVFRPRAGASPSSMPYGSWMGP